jgi:nucleoside-diphosphate-sugar epimerase
MSKLIFGCGYLGGRVARLWHEAGHTVHVVTRSERRAEELAEAGYRPIVADVCDAASFSRLPSAETVLFAVGYDRNSRASIVDVYAGGLKTSLDALAGEPERIIYTSSTGVYGQTDGGMVDENSPTEPGREGGRACLAAERVLAAHRLGQVGIVLRLAGIYGPGRVPFLDRVRFGQPISVPQEGHLNLIHVDDAAAFVLAAEARATPPRTYCVGDGHPVVRRDYYGEVARVVGASEPIFATAEATSAVASRASTDKRICNDRLRAELGVSLSYPSYREGLRAILAGS